ncbi:MAG: DUF554 domain-containing protein [Eubacteriales bacterium]|nr:DUF554 domain-containing protein [Eubacteriales bacterium]
MHGLGTIINTLAVAVGGLVGMHLKSGISEKMQKTLMQACGVATIFIGAGGTLSRMFVSNGDGTFGTQGTLMMILSMVIGGLIGEWLDVEAGMEYLGERLKKAVKAEKDNGFVDGFVNVSLIICVGAMAIVGAIQDGISGDYSMLTAKAILDMIIVMVFASTYGVGAVFSALAILVYQGSITLLAMLFGSIASDSLIWALAYVGSALIFCVGINIAFGKKFRVGNLLPALVIAGVLQVICDLTGYVLP